MSAAEREVPSSSETGEHAPAELGRRRSQTIARKELRRQQVHLAPDAEADLVELRAARPRVRGDCAGGERPCPWVSCRYHLYLDVTEAGSLKLHFPDREVWELEQTCALDVADQGGVTLEQVGVFANLTRERIRQVETRTLEAARRAIETMEPTMPVTVAPSPRFNAPAENEQLLRIEALLRRILEVLQARPAARGLPELPAPPPIVLHQEPPPPSAPTAPTRSNMARDPSKYVRLETVLDFVRSRGTARAGEISQFLGMTRGAAEVALSKLTKQKRLRRVEMGLYAVEEPTP